MLTVLSNPVTHWRGFCLIVAFNFVYNPRQKQQMQLSAISRQLESKTQSVDVSAVTSPPGPSEKAISYQPRPKDHAEVHAGLPHVAPVGGVVRGKKRTAHHQPRTQEPRVPCCSDQSPQQQVTRFAGGGGFSALFK